MTNRHSPSLRTAVFAAVAVIGIAGTAHADAIEDRQASMKNVGKAIGALAKIAKKEAPFDAAVVNTNATTMADNLKTAKGQFPDGSATGAKETWAKAEIWQNKADFDAKMDKSVEAAMAMAAVTAEADFGAALGALGNTCKACHQDYRRPKQ